MTEDALAHALDIARIGRPYTHWPASGVISTPYDNPYDPAARFVDFGLARAVAEILNAVNEGRLVRPPLGWQLLPEGRDRSKLGNVLIAAMYPDGRTMSDVYHDWWTFGGWARWKHPFPPTHYMVVQPLPALPAGASA